MNRSEEYIIFLVQMGSSRPAVAGQLPARDNHLVAVHRRASTPRNVLFLMFLALAALSTMGHAGNAVLVVEGMQEKADMAFKKENYARAFRLYKPLAEVSDKFSAYRIAIMYESGLHVDQDIIEAYAWSYLAAETDIPNFRNYNEAIKRRLSDDKLQQARKRAGELIMEHGIYMNAVETKQTIRRMMFQCAGSRVGNSCSHVEGIWVGCNFTISEVPFSGQLPSPACLRFGIIGLANPWIMPLVIRDTQKGLDEVIDQYQPGRVELGDFELIDDDEPQDDQQ
ncbi:MAG: hypothetical protein PF630_06790 [Gammaproteobacteria bacterium]|jgi:hypothetical protein|nr:hypothetical protein [Gammaproteobacteria bacterium]